MASADRAAGSADPSPPRHGPNAARAGQCAFLLCDNRVAPDAEPADMPETPSSDWLACENSPFSWLPVELHHNIFSYLNHVELATVAVVCRRWRRLAMAPLLWRNLTITRTCDVEGTCIFSCTPFLCSLTLNLTSWVDFIHVAQHLLIHGCPRLTALNMGFCQGIDYCGVRLLIAVCPRLEELNLEGCEEVDDEVVAAILLLRHLKRLNLSHCRRITDKAIHGIATSCENLESLDVNGNTFITDCAIIALASSRKASLRVLCLDGECLTDASYVMVSQCEKLTTLRIWYAEQMTDEGLMALMSLKELQHLEIRQAKELTSLGLNMLFEGGNLDRLVSLNLNGCHQLQDRAVIVFSQGCPYLQHLVLAWCWEVTDGGLESIVNHSRFLVDLDLTGLLMLKGTCLLKIPESLPRLKCLDVQQCGQVLDSLLVQLHKVMPALVILNYYGEIVSVDMISEDASDASPPALVFVVET